MALSQTSTVVGRSAILFTSHDILDYVMRIKYTPIPLPDRHMEGSTCSSASEGEGDWEDVDSEEERGSEGSCLCLFCSRELGTAGEVLEHCISEHGWNFFTLRASLG